ncbi:MAG: AAA family ATPase, partial [Victivallaceae bacterium]
MKDLTSSVYTFEDLIDGNFLYVDKTEYLWQLIQPAKGIFFLSRPRRFGKSLTLSTLKAVFQGKKHLFKGLSLESKSYDWKEYPVIHIDLGLRPIKNAKELSLSLTTSLDKIASEYGITLSGGPAAFKFSELIIELQPQGKVVILIDEYDKPILDNIISPEAESIRRELEDFYSVVKGTEPYQRFVLLTGVSKFSKVSVFSKLNNLADISMDAKYATMLGYTQDELEHYFPDYIDHTVKLLQTTCDDLLKQMKLWYNGYRFHSNAPTVYNPVSIAKFFDSNGEFQNFWFETGTPGFLLKVAKEQGFNFEDALSRPVSRLAFSAYEIGKLKTLPLLYQTGYLTIADTVKDRFETFYRLDFPNREVEGAFDAYLIDEYTRVDQEDVAVIVS